MSRKRFLKRSVVLGAAILVALAVTCPAAMAEARIYNLYKMTGKIAAIDHTYNTVVVDVPLANGQVFVVGGPFAKDAALKSQGRPATLADFNVGERVIVKWSPTPEGHLIRMMESL